MTSWIVAILIAIVSLGYGALLTFADMMSDAPTADKTSKWPVWAGLFVAAAIVASHKLIG